VLLYFGANGQELSKPNIIIFRFIYQLLCECSALCMQNKVGNLLLHFIGADYGGSLEGHSAWNGLRTLFLVPEMRPIACLLDISCFSRSNSAFLQKL
jgi:hypothetical protein